MRRVPVAFAVPPEMRRLVPERPTDVRALDARAVRVGREAFVAAFDPAFDAVRGLAIAFDADFFADFFAVVLVVALGIALRPVFDGADFTDDAFARVVRVFDAAFVPAAARRVVADFVLADLAVAVALRPAVVDLRAVDFTGDFDEADLRVAGFVLLFLAAALVEGLAAGFVAGFDRTDVRAVVFAPVALRAVVLRAVVLRAAVLFEVERVLLPCVALRAVGFERVVEVRVVRLPERAVVDFEGIVQLLRDPRERTGTSSVSGEPQAPHGRRKQAHPSAGPKEVTADCDRPHTRAASQIDRRRSENQKNKPSRDKMARENRPALRLTPDRRTVCADLLSTLPPEITRR